MTSINSRTVPAKSVLLRNNNLALFNRTYQNFLFSAFIGLTLSSQAHSNDALKMTVSASKVVVDSNGNKGYIPVSTAKIGTVIQYKATYKNTLDTSIHNTAVTLPIPANTVFTGEAYPPSAQGSIDYYNYHDIPLMRKVNGTLKEVPFSEYKSLRWDIKYIPPHKSVKVAFNTIVN